MRILRAWSVVLVSALACGACSELHGGPQDGTETGNPPVTSPFLKETLVALVVTADQVRVAGKPGAATPGAQVEVVSSLTQQVLRGPVASDGSFDVVVNSSPLDTFEVRVVTASAKSSNTVFVVQGAAAVTGSRDGELSCSQRENLARQQLDALINSRLTEGGSYARCRIDSDCTTVSGGSACNDSCSTYAISKVGAEEIALATDSVEAGLCKTFTADGCTVIAQPCAPPLGEIACVGSVQCQLVNRSGGPDCADRAVCVNGTKEIWPSVCSASVTEIPSASVNVVCIENDKGQVALTMLRGDIAVTNKGWASSSYGLFPDSLSPNGSTRCAQQKAALGAGNISALASCVQ